MNLNELPEALRGMICAEVDAQMRDVMNAWREKFEPFAGLDNWISLEQLAALWQVGVDSLRDQTRAGWLPHAHPSRSRLIYNKAQLVTHLARPIRFACEYCEERAGKEEKGETETNSTNAPNMLTPKQQRMLREVK
jgi:hypothetical protein